MLDFLCKAVRQALDLKVKRGMRKGPAHLLPFLPLHLTQGIDCWGDTHLIPTDDLCRGKGQNPQLPANLPWGKWLPELELTFGSGLFMQLKGHTVWKRNAISPQPLTDYRVREWGWSWFSHWPASISQGHPFPLPLPLSSWADDSRACGWVERRDSALPIGRAMPSTEPGSWEELKWLSSEPVGAYKILFDKRGPMET